MMDDLGQVEKPALCRCDFGDQFCGFKIPKGSGLWCDKRFERCEELGWAHRFDAQDIYKKPIIRPWMRPAGLIVFGFGLLWLTSKADSALLKTLNVAVGVSMVALPSLFAFLRSRRPRNMEQN